jgi:hypothetical protein
MKSVASARPKSKPDDVKKLERLHHRKWRFLIQNWKTKPTMPQEK